MVNSICSLVSICLIPRQWTRCTEWQRSVNESLPVGYAASCEALSVAMGSVSFEEKGGAASVLLSPTKVPSRVVLEFGDAISGISRVSGQAARSIG